VAGEVHRRDRVVPVLPGLGERVDVGRAGDRLAAVQDEERAGGRIGLVDPVAEQVRVGVGRPIELDAGAGAGGDEARRHGRRPGGRGGGLGGGRRGAVGDGGRPGLAAPFAHRRDLVVVGRPRRGGDVEIARGGDGGGVHLREAAGGAGRAVDVIAADRRRRGG